MILNYGDSMKKLKNPIIPLNFKEFKLNTMPFLKTIKPKLLLLVLTLLMFSCDIVNSLFPFYTQGTIYFEKAIVGTWANKTNETLPILDSKNGYTDSVDYNNLWRFKAVNNLNEADTLINFNMFGYDVEKIKIYKEKYSGGYIAYYEEIVATLNKDGSPIDPTTDESQNPGFYKKKVSWFMAMPFKINNQLFLDFTPLDNYIQRENINSLLENHSIETHSLAIVNQVSKNKFDISWLAAGKVDSLIDNKKIKIKHEKYGVNAFLNQSTLLTAPPEELQSFIKKYMNSKDEKKWDGGKGFKLDRYYEKTVKRIE